jgi:GMP synthase-like glutamine amidotransferase
VLALVHERDAGPGVFADVSRARGAELDEWFVPDGGPPPRDPLSYAAILSLGGGMHPDQEAAHPWLRNEKALLAQWLERGVPVLGVCLGSELLAESAGAPARPAAAPEVGWYEVELTPEGARDRLLGPEAPRFQALEWHSYESPLPRGAMALARSGSCLQAFRLGERAWGIQFHAEVSLGDFESWLDEERSPEEQERLGFDTEPLRTATRASIGEWNRLGRSLFERFLDLAGGVRA